MRVVFYQTEQGNEPVREWLKVLSKLQRKQIGEDIKTVQYGWPIGMPVVRKLDKDLWETRTIVEHHKMRVMFTLYENNIVLLHGFLKKSMKTPKEDLSIARKRLKEIH